MPANAGFFYLILTETTWRAKIVLQKKEKI